MNKRSFDFMRRFNSSGDAGFSIKNVAKWTAIAVILLLGGFGVVKTYQILFGDGGSIKERYSPFATEPEKYIEERNKEITNLKAKIDNTVVAGAQKMFSHVALGTSDSSRIMEERFKADAEIRSFKPTDTEIRSRNRELAWVDFKHQPLTLVDERGAYVSNMVHGRYAPGNLSEQEALERHRPGYVQEGMSKILNPWIEEHTPGSIPISNESRAELLKWGVRI